MGANRVVRTVFPVCLLAVSLLFSGCGSKEEKVAKFIARGDQLMEKGDPVKAVLEYKNALQIDPKNARGKFALGKAYLKQKEMRQAFASFRGALELDPGLDEARLEVASLLALSGQGQRVLNELGQLREPQKYQPRVEIIRAQAYHSLKQPQAGIDVLKGIPGGEKLAEVQALLAVLHREMGDAAAMEEAAGRWRSLDPKNPSSYILLAQHAARSGNKERVARELNAMVEANPGESKVALLRAQMLEGFKMPEEAAEAFDQLPGDLDLQKARAVFLQQRGDLAGARKTLETVLAAKPSDTDAVLQLVRVMVAGNETQPAVDFLDKTLKLDLKGVERERILLAKASLKADLSEMESAKTICQEVLKQNQGNMDAHLLLGTILLSQGKSEEAEIHLNQVAKAQPDNANAQIYLARSQLQNKKDALAVETLRNALAVSPASREVRFELVRVHLVQKDPEQAVRVLDQGLEQSPGDLMFLRARGEIQTSRKEFGKAEQDFRQMVRTAPQDALGYMEMGYLMLAQSRHDEALKWFREVLEKEKGWEAALPALIRAFAAKGDPGGALAAVEAEAARKPESGLLQFYLGKLQAQQNALDKAERAYLRATEIAPDWFEPYRALAELYTRQGKKDEALAKMEEIYRKNPTPAVVMNLAVLYENRGRRDEATRLFDEVIQKSNRAPSVLNDLAYLFAETRQDAKDLARAAEMAAQALAREPENPAIKDTVAWVAFKQGNLDAAWFHLQEALVKQPDVGILNLHAAIVAKAKGDKQLAMDLLEKAINQKSDLISHQRAMELKKEWEG